MFLQQFILNQWLSCYMRRFIDPLFVHVREALPGASRKDESRFHQLLIPRAPLIASCCT